LIKKHCHRDKTEQKCEDTNLVNLYRVDQNVIRRNMEFDKMISSAFEFIKLWINIIWLSLYRL